MCYLLLHYTTLYITLYITLHCALYLHIQESLRVCSGWHSPLLSLISSTPPSSLSSHPAYDRDPLTYPLTRYEHILISVYTLYYIYL